MQDNNTVVGNSMSRPMARPVTAPMPIQRGNYGIPPRQAVAAQPLARPPQPVPMAATNQFMDIAPAPAPVAAPMPTPTLTAAPMPIAQPVAQPVPVQVAAPQISPAPAQRPLFTPNPVAAAQPAPSRGAHRRPKLFTAVRFGVVVVASLLLVAGIGRWATAGSTAKDTIAVGAVAANDGRSMTIQFTATDGKLHKFSVASDKDLIPGSATEIAYRSGAPEATARQVAVIKGNRHAGAVLVMTSIIGVGVYGIMTMIVRHKSRSKHRATPLTTALTA